MISRVYARVIYQHEPATDATSEGLSVFLVASDPDGIENLSSFYVISDTQSCSGRWTAPPGSSSTAEGETWIGSNNLFMPGCSGGARGGLPGAILQNAGGDTVEETFTVASRETSAAAAAYPTASVSEGAIHLGGAYQSADVWTYGKDGRFVATFTASRKGPALDAQKMAAGVPARPRVSRSASSRRMPKAGTGPFRAPTRWARCPLHPQPCLRDSRALYCAPWTPTFLRLTRGRPALAPFFSTGQAGQSRCRRSLSASSTQSPAGWSMIPWRYGPARSGLRGMQ